jgi:predicted AlkP superfamily pyrophosphatase or phosphodiesterase
MRPLRILLTTALALATSSAPALNACAATVEETARKPATTAVEQTARKPAPSVVVAISVDGLNPTAIKRLGKTGTPALHRMIDKGAGTLNARSARELTRTLPNHTGMLTGRPIKGDRGHQVTFNEDNGSILPAVAGGYVAGVFDVVHDHGMRTAFYSSKDKFNFLDRSWDTAHGASDKTGADDGRDKIDRYVVDTEADNVTRLVERLRRSPDAFSFVHLAQPDQAGHASGFMSPTYLRAVTAADKQIGRILDAVRSDRALRARTTVVLTADHGGKGSTHADATRRADYRVPFLTWGAGVAKGAGLYDLNADRRKNPGRARTSYAGTQPVRNAEVANVVTGLLDLPLVPGSVFGRTRLLLSRS